MPYNPGVSPTSAKSGNPAAGESLPQTVGWLSLPEMRHQNHYVWFVFFSALDIMLTWAILRRGGREVNPVADQIIEMWGLTGAILFKFSLTMLVIVVCEIVARTRSRTARWLATTAMVVSAIPVAYSLLLLMMHTLQDGL